MVLLYSQKQRLGHLGAIWILECRLVSDTVIGILHPLAGVFGVGSHVAQSVHPLGGQTPAVELVQSDFPLVHVVLGVHPVELGGDQAAH